MTTPGAEQQLLDSISDERLRISLSMIKHAVQDIWDAGNPRIIQDFTDHGLAHYARIAKYAHHLLDLNQGRVLSAVEMYLLLAGIYLHDIGMQCDVVRNQPIKERAEKFGAQFTIQFTASTANRYSPEEQKEVRKNHHYLSAAWIDYASRTGQTPLGQAAKTIPDDLIDDLLNVCLYHTKLSISNCPLISKHDPTRRIQFIAALLRFADELDIDAGRVVPIDTIKSFGFEPGNAVYWWMHTRTKVVFNPSNAVVLTVRLHPDNMADLGPLVYKAFIGEFQHKNAPVIEILNQNGIPVTISATSLVIEHDRVEPLPGDVIQALQGPKQTQQSQTPANSGASNPPMKQQPDPPVQSSNNTSAPTQPSGPIDRIALRNKMMKHLSSNDIQDLCYSMKVDYDTLSGNDKSAKIRELLLYCERRDRLHDLVDHCQRLFGDISWV